MQYLSFDLKRITKITIGKFHKGVHRLKLLPAYDRRKKSKHFKMRNIGWF